ncbi:replicative DNA helicase [Streptomyces populi]|uniref:Replicative DNA helicase n=1 Tax=Streptomyces populi TaxID=2058924 RepID=A0A2I0SQW8_9ACTN|nr:DnaB-like helicase N-terminal domain-containing protein [Streptomyces populi]PKT72330.1 replicative DNA helicase [Streptomyces populi]
MPRTPETGEDDLAGIPPPDPVFHVEQALLGAFLLEPHRLGDVTGITGASFGHYAHTALFAAIRSLPVPDPAEHAKNTQWLDAVLTTARQQARGLTPSYLHDLIQLCPQPRHAPAYARIVEAEHSRRLLRAAAQHLTQTTRDTSLPHPVPTAFAEADALAAVVDDVATRFPPRSSSLPRTVTPPAAIHGGEEAAGEERLLLAAATARPADVGRMRWLTADDFTRPFHAGLWRCLNTLIRRGTPVDPVTVLWEAQHRGLLGTEVEPEHLLGLLTEPAGSPEHWGELVLQRSVLTTAHHIGQRIEAFIDDPATTPCQLVVGSRRALADLSAIRTRWQQATSSSPAPANRPTRPTAARTTSAPRAGPPRTAAPVAHTSRCPPPAVR